MEESIREMPIGVFDSGLGGLTAVKEILKIMPNEDIIYFGDTGRVPYGNKSSKTIEKYANQDIAFLKSFGVKMLIAACGTVSSVITDTMSKKDEMFTGVLKPTCIKASNTTKNGNIAVLGTLATIKSKSYVRELKKLNPNLNIIEQACPMFVPLVENGMISKDDIVVNTIVKRYLSNIKGADTVILGCTHYPIINDAISSFLGDNVVLIDPGRETAVYAYHLLKDKALLSNNKGVGNCSFYVSDNLEGFSATAEIFLDRKMESNVSLIDIENY